MMQDEWKFYGESGQLWQVRNLKNNEKHGKWLRYYKQGNLEYEESFENGKIKK